MKKENGKITIASFFALALLGYIAYSAFILISNKVKSDITQKEILESIHKIRATDSLPSKATQMIISALEAKGYTLDNSDKQSIEVFVDKQKKVLELYYSYSYEMDFLLFKHVKLIEVESSSSTERLN